MSPERVAALRSSCREALRRKYAEIEEKLRPPKPKPLILEPNQVREVSREFGGLHEVFAAFTQGLIPELNDPDQRMAFEIYLNTNFGLGSQHLPSQVELDRIIAIWKEYPELRRKRTFQETGLTVQRLDPVPVSAELRAFTDRLYQTARETYARLFLIQAHRGHWRKILQTTDLSIIPAELERALQDPKIDLVERAGGLYKFLEHHKKTLSEKGEITRPISQAIVDLIHATGVLSDETALALIKSDYTQQRLQGIKRFAQSRDSLAMRFGFVGHFRQVLIQNRIAGPRGLSHPSELENAPFIFGKDLAPALRETGDIEEFRLRSLSVAESPERSCIGGSDCSTRTYLERAFDPAFHYFTLTDPEGISSGHMTIALGQIELAKGQVLQAAFVDKVQNVPDDLIEPMLSGLKLTLSQSGYRLALPMDLGDINGISNDLSTRLAVQRVLDRLGQSEMGQWIPPESAYPFAKGYSRALGATYRVALYSPPENLKAKITLGHLISPWTTQRIPIRELIADAIQLREGSFEDRIKYLKLVQLLERMKQVGPEEHRQLFAGWIDLKPEPPLPFLYELILFWLNYNGSSFEVSGMRKLSHLSASTRWHLFDRLSSKWSQSPSALEFTVLASLAQDSSERILKLKGNISFLTLLWHMSSAQSELGGNFRGFGSPLLSDALSRLSPESRGWIENDIWTDQQALRPGLVQWLSRNSISPQNKARLLQDLWPLHESMDELNDCISHIPSDQKELIWKEVLTQDAIRTAHAAYLEAERRSHGCFAEGTKVFTPKGEKQIESLQIGEAIFAYDFLSGEVTQDTIVAVKPAETRLVITLRLSDGLELTQTPEHPFYSATRRKFIPASQLELGEEVLRKTPQGLQRVKLISREAKKDPVRVYNFETQKHHNYLIEGVLVHNVKIVMM